jgi:hypothetical protein
MDDARERRRIPSGEAHHSSRLTSAEVIEARVAYAKTDLSAAQIGVAMGITRRSMDRILTGVDRKFEEGPLKKVGSRKVRSGERVGNSKLKEVYVLSMRCLYATGKHSLEDLARRFEVDPSLVGSIVKGKIWKSAPGPIHEGPMHEFKDYPSGASARRAMLTNDQVKSMRERYAAGGVKIAYLAGEFGMNEEHIRKILKGKGYHDAGGPIASADGRTTKRERLCIK